MMLTNYLKHNTFLSVYDDTIEDESFHVCRFICKDDVFVLFQAISTRGYDDGLYMIPLDTIYRIDVDDAYTRRLEKLFLLHNQKIIDDFIFTEETLLTQILAYAEKNDLIISIFLNGNDTITGTVFSIDDDVCCMKALTEDGKTNGMSYVCLSKIEKIICNSGVERCTKMLRKSAEGQGDGSVS